MIRNKWNPPPPSACLQPLPHAPEKQVSLNSLGKNPSRVQSCSPVFSPVLLPGREKGSVRRRLFRTGSSPTDSPWSSCASRPAGLAFSQGPRTHSLHSH